MSNLAQTNPIQPVDPSPLRCPAIDNSTFGTTQDALNQHDRVCVTEDTTDSALVVGPDQVLYGQGGVIDLTGPARINGSIVSQTKIFNCVTDQHFYNASLPFDVRWTGMVTADPAAATANKDAFICAWNMSRRGGTLASGNEMTLAGGTFIVDPIDVPAETTLNHGDVGIRGGTMELAAGSNATLLRIDGFAQGALKETYMKNVAFHGNKANNAATPVGTPLVDISTYSLNMEDIEIVGAAQDGIRFQNFQRYRVDGLNTQRNGGWGLVIDGVMSFHGTNIDVESNDAGGILIRGGDTPPRDYQTAIVLDTVYSENLAGKDLIRLEGVGGVTVRNVPAEGNVTFASHPTFPNQPSQYNNMDLTSFRGNITFEKGNSHNTVHRNRAMLERTKVFDLDGMNTVLNPPGQDVDSDFSCSSWSYNFPSPGAGLIRSSYPEDIGGVPGDNPYLATSNHHIKLTTAAVGASVRADLPQTNPTPAGKFYWQVVGDADHNVDTFVSIDASDGTGYDFETCQFTAGTTGSNKIKRLPTLKCRWKSFTIPFELAATKTLTFRIWGKVWVANEEFRIYYTNYSTRKNLGIYKNVNHVVQQVGEPSTV